MSTTPITIRIKGYGFQFPSRYAPGHILTEGEAHALNQVLATNIRNNVDGLVGSVEPPEGETFLTVEQVEALQLQISRYVEGYALGESRKPAQAPARGMLEQEAWELAREKVLETRTWEDPGLAQAIEDQEDVFGFGFKRQLGIKRV